MTTWLSLVSHPCSSHSRVSCPNCPWALRLEPWRAAPVAVGAASGESPIVAVAICFPDRVSTTAILFSSHTAKSRFPCRSMASPEGDSHSLSFHVPRISELRASSLTMLFLSSMLTKTVPLPSVCGKPVQADGFPWLLSLAIVASYCLWPLSLFVRQSIEQRTDRVSLRILILARSMQQALRESC